MRQEKSSSAIQLFVYTKKYSNGRMRNNLGECVHARLPFLDKSVI
jgi:hypothetical protein